MADLHQASAADLKARIEAARTGAAFLAFRDGDGTQRLLTLPADASTTVGRAQSADVALDWDPEVSRLHAELRPVGRRWALTDDGLSRNGSYVNGERLDGRRLLEDGDELQLGGTTLLFRDPFPDDDAGEATHTAASRAEPVAVTEGQRRVLIALCRPFLDGNGFAGPATNHEISDELYLSVPAVKTHLRGLFGRFEIGDLPQNEKRLRLVQLATSAGLISLRDLRDE